MNLEQKSNNPKLKKNEKSNFHVQEFFKSFMVGGVVGLLLPEYSMEDKLTISFGCGFVSFPIMDRYFRNMEWKEAYERSPAYTTGLLTGQVTAEYIKKL